PLWVACPAGTAGRSLGLISTSTICSELSPGSSWSGVGSASGEDSPVCGAAVSVCVASEAVELEASDATPPQAESTASPSAAEPARAAAESLCRVPGCGVDMTWCTVDQTNG